MRRYLWYNGMYQGGVYALLYAIIALVALVILAAWLIWRCRTLHVTLTRTQAHLQQMNKERARRQNLQQLLERREAEIRRLHQRLDTYESDFQEMESRTSDLNMSLFRESGLRILAEKEEGANRLKLEQLEKQVSDARKKLRQQQDESAETIRRMQDLINTQEKEIARLRQANARRIKKTPADNVLNNQITLDDVLGQ